MEIKDRIYSLRKKKKYTLEELGKIIGVSKQTVSRYESGEITHIPYDNIVAIAKALDCTPGYLMGWEDNLTDESAEAVANLMKVAEDAIFLQKYNSLSEENKKEVHNYVDFLLSKERTNKD